MENLVNILLETDLFIYNNYFKNYVELILNNLTTQFERSKTQQHHIIPKYYYLDNNKSINNSSENLVNLLYKDHILAHYYLALCSKTPFDKSRNVFSIKYILNGQTLESFNLNDLDKYQELYEQSKIDLLQKTHSYKISQQISKTLKSKKIKRKIIKSNTNKIKIRKEPIKNIKLSILASKRCGERNNFYGKHHSDLTKQRISIKNSKAVRMLDLNTGIIIKEFNSITQAAEYLFNNQIAVSKPAAAGEISAVCRNRMRQAYSYKWEFINKV